MTATEAKNSLNNPVVVLILGALLGTGVGFYPANANRAGWVHYDIGPVRRWRG